MLSNFKLDFNYYGLLLGLAASLAWWWWEKKLAGLGVKWHRPNLVWAVVWLAVVVGARTWHVVTDWSLYSAEWWKAVAIWNGGLSILGALVGLVIGLVIVSKLERVRLSLLLDVAALVLPWAQALGRWGNYFNQELFGPVTTLPWGIMVGGQKVQPLFLYESLLLIGLGLTLHFWSKANANFSTSSSMINRDGQRNFSGLGRLGSGRFFLFYLNYYLIVRFFLDFLRVQKTMFNQWLGLNQVIILVILIMMGLGLLTRKKYGKKH